MAEDANGIWVDYVSLNGRLIGRVSGGQLFAIHTDQVGWPESATNASRSIVWSANNFAFDRQVVTEGFKLNLGFPGQYIDDETKTWNNGFRDYRADWWRYVESDPLGLPAGLNTYVYVRGNSLSYTDSLGLFVRGTYSLSTGILSFYDTSNPRDVYSTFASTGGTFASDGSFVSNGDAIPVGIYDILGSRTPGWYRLDPEDGTPFNDVDDSSGRGAFRLHPGTHSLGCVTVNKNSYDNTLYQNIRNLIDHTMTTTISDKSRRSLIPGPYPIRYGGAVGTPVTYFGKLDVTP